MRGHKIEAASFSHQRKDIKRIQELKKVRNARICCEVRVRAVHAITNLRT